MSIVHRRAATLSRRGLLRLTAGGALLLTAAGHVPSVAASRQIANGAATGTFLDPATIHQIAVTFDAATYEAMVKHYVDTGEKGWIEATVAIDGTTYARAGMRLKGNSSLMGLRDNGAVEGGFVRRVGGREGHTADQPENLPWLIRLDKNGDNQTHNGITELVIRSNHSATSLNEAVALELLAEAGLTSQQAAPSAFRINDGSPALRLAIEHPNDAWMAAHFSAAGLLYKCEATGDWEYRGDDPEAYAEIFDLEAGGSGDDTANIAPLAAFLDFLNNSDDATFAAELPQRLDLDQFAVYLAMMDLIANFDDIDGPGNNGYLYYDPSTERFTVAPWDMNLAFVSPEPGVSRAFPAGGEGPVQIDLPGSAPDAAGTPAAGNVLPGTGNGGPVVAAEVPLGVRPDGEMTIVGRQHPNPLVERFTAVVEYTALVEEQSARLRTDLYDSGAAASILARWVSVLEHGASELVDQATIESDAAAIAAFFERPA